MKDRIRTPDPAPADLGEYIGEMLAELAALAARGGLSGLAASIRFAALEAARGEPKTAA